MDRFIRVLQKDIVTNPEQWKDAGPGKFIKLPDRAKRVYCVLSVIAFSTAGNAEGKFARKVGRLGKGWFWTSHAILQQLTGSCQKTVQRAIRELEKAGFIGYHPARKSGHQCFFNIRRISYNGQESFRGSFSRPKSVGESVPELPHEKANEQTGAKLKTHQPSKAYINTPYSEKSGLFQRGKNTHDDSGEPIDTTGAMAILLAFEDAEYIAEKEGEEAFLKYVIENKIENHLTPKYKAKLAEMKNR